MTISVWRYSHLTLAVSCFLFLSVAAVTGIILAFEPVSQKIQGYTVTHAENRTLAQTAPLLKKKYTGIKELSLNEFSQLVMFWTDSAGTDKKNFVNPETGALLGEPRPKTQLFQWATTLHRSLFLHETGRLIVGITAFLFILITLSGIALVIQRQQKLKRFFAPLHKTGGTAYYHVLFGRFCLFPMLAIALTGSMMSVYRFGIKEDKKIRLEVNEDAIKSTPEKPSAEFTVFRQTSLASLQKLTYPFSDFPEDYYILQTKTGEMAVNQFTGDILASQSYSRAYLLNNFSLRWHTGRTGVVWALLLAITAGYILFFIGSGFMITWQRLGKGKRPAFTPEESRIIILTGSENGSTKSFARIVAGQLAAHGEKVYLGSLNQYQLFPNAEYMLIMTSTYGIGDAPANASQFFQKLPQYPQQQQIKVAVAGFGSRSYPDFCQFGVDVDNALRRQPWALPSADITTIDEQSLQDFSHWLTVCTQLTGHTFYIPQKLASSKVGRLMTMKVVNKTEAAPEASFLISLAPARTKHIVSGDLLAIYPKNDHRERLYSIGKTGDHLQLSVKRHAHGLGSGYLHQLQPGQKISARIIKNNHFHFPSRAGAVIMIANGTGIAPFLGMMQENSSRKPCYLFCGFRTSADFDLYNGHIKTQLASGQLAACYTAFSREGQKQYVHHLLEQHISFVWEQLEAGAALMLCGSLAMQKDTMALLEVTCQARTGNNLEAFLSEGQLLSDCY